MKTINFRSDNEAPVADEILEAIVQANVGAVHSYGEDAASDGLKERFCSLFGCDLSVFPVISGTAANALALSQICPPFGAIYCHEHAHVNTDECGAPELFTGGAKLQPLPGEHGKVHAQTLADVLTFAGELGDHEAKPCALSLSQATEAGTAYTQDELKELSAIAHRYGLLVHMDGARFANAIQHLGCTPADLTWRAGVDILSFGATKNGAMAAEAIVVFQSEHAKDLGRRRKRGGHLISKMRFVVAQLEAYISHGLWLRLASQANQAAAHIASGLASLPGIELLYPVQANEVFVRLPAQIADGLAAAGFEFHRWPGTHDIFRMVTSSATSEEDVAALVKAARGLAASS